MKDPTSVDSERYLPGYYRSVSVYAPSEGDAIATLRDNVTDGQIDWSCSDFAEGQKTWRDRVRILRGGRIRFEGGRAFFPSEEAEGQDDSPIGWTMGKNQD
jgi:hypothetical protein